MSRPAPPQLLEFLTAYDPQIADLALRLRGIVLEAAPSATEMVYDTYEALALTYTFSGRLKEAFCHIALYTAHVNLGFNRGRELPDPNKLLQGTGKLIRHLRIASLADLESPNLQRLLAEAIQLGEGMPGPPNPRRPMTIIKITAGAKKRPRPY